MRGVMKRGSGAAIFFAAIGLLRASTASAANTTWDFIFSGSTFPQPSPAPPGVGIGVRVDPPSGFIGQYTAPNGISTGIFNNELSSGAGQTYDSISQFQNSKNVAAVSTWSLSTGQSQYQFTPDFSGISANSLPQVAITSPSDGATTSDQPTFNWSIAGVLNGEEITISGDQGPQTFVGLLPTSTSFTVPTALAPGNYEFFLDWSAAAVNVPVAINYVSGPTLTITPNGTFQSSGEAFESFTVAPEPTSLAAALSLSLMIRRRR